MKYPCRLFITHKCLPEGFRERQEHKLIFIRGSVANFKLMKLKLLLFLLILSSGLAAQNFYMGLDLSYTNEMEDCDVVYYVDNVDRDPFAIFAEQGANLARFRLWHSPDWTNYSTLADVKISIARAKTQGMAVLLDFHYSDTWADPGNQLRPAAWNNIDDITLLGDSLYNYTFEILETLNNEGLLPEMVQIGNETNGNILLKSGEALYPIDWGRTANLFSRALEAVEHFNALNAASVKTIIHIAAPENALWWFQEAKTHNLTQFDIIGISYYPGWSNLSLRQAANAVGELIATYGKEVMIVETAYPWTLEWVDNASNNLGADNLLKTHGLVASPQAQFDFLSELSWLVREQGGSAVMYWEPGWVSSDCSTPWGQGSHWENATLFDFDYQLHEGAAYLTYDYNQMPEALNPVEVVFKVDMTGVDTTNGVFVTGDFTGENWQFKRMQNIGDNIFEYSTTIPGRSQGAYVFHNKADWGEQWREPIPEECALMWNTHREFVIEKEATTFGYVWGSCTKIDETSISDFPATAFNIAPNPAHNLISVSGIIPIRKIEILSVDGGISKFFSFAGINKVELNITDFRPGIYLIKITDVDNNSYIQKFIKK